MWAVMQNSEDNKIYSTVFTASQLTYKLIHHVVLPLGEQQYQMWKWIALQGFSWTSFLIHKYEHWTNTTQSLSNEN